MATLDHVGLRVQDLDRSIAFYTAMFGLQLEDRRFFPGGTVEAGMLRVSADSVIFLLCESGAAPWPATDIGRPEHFCLLFEAAEFEAVMDRLERGGVFDRLDCELKPRTGAHGRTDSKYILDPDNNIIEVKRRPAPDAGEPPRQQPLAPGNAR